MSRNSIHIDAPPERVFDVLDDPCAYPRWVVGARRVRRVDPEWPQPGARFHHALGAPGSELHDSTLVLDRDRPRRLRLEVRFRPVGVAVVDLRVEPTDGGSRVTMDERQTAGPAAMVPRLVVDPLFAARNELSLRRLRREVERLGAGERPTDIGALLDGRSVATAESCTGGMLAQALVREEGSGDWYRGGMVTYQRDVKFDVLGVTPGPVVTTRAAREMAEGVARRLGADVAVSITGAAGPDPHDGAEPGTVVIGVLVDDEVDAHLLHLDGDPQAVCVQATDRALQLLAGALTARLRAPVHEDAPSRR